MLTFRFIAKPMQHQTVMTTQKKTYVDVLLYVPNLIGYTRVLLTLIAYYFALPHDDDSFLFSENPKLEDYKGA